MYVYARDVLVASQNSHCVFCAENKPSLKQCHGRGWYPKVCEVKLFANVSPKYITNSLFSFYTTITDMPWNVSKSQLNKVRVRWCIHCKNWLGKILDTETITLYSLQNKHQDTATVAQGLIYQVKYYRMQVTQSPAYSLLIHDIKPSWSHWPSYHKGATQQDTRETSQRESGNQSGTWVLVHR